MRWFVFLFLLILLVTGVWYVKVNSSKTVITPIGQIFEKPLEKYAIERLGQRIFEGSQIVLDDAIATTSGYTAYNFHFIVDNKKITGLVHLPSQASISDSMQKFPVIVQFRGYIDRETYISGDGTRRSAEVFARNGFISIAPDFLGYGGSDMPSTDIFEERFQTYIVALELLESIKTLPQANPDYVGIWGHSNGGQIALTVLEATQKPYPTTLWAPVSKPFPYSILYYTDEATDRGKLIRKRLAKFEEDYDVELYSVPNYLSRISAPMQIHQGSADDPVPKKWSDELVQEFKIQNSDLPAGKAGLNIQYFVYPGVDHNMLGAWNMVVNRDIEFFNRYL